MSVQAYYQQAEALLDGGVDLFLIETIFDTLNAKAAIYALEDLFEARNVRIPVFLTGTFIDESGRTLSGQTSEAFWNCVSHAKPFAVGLNCGLGAADMQPHLKSLAEAADCYVFCYPSAGLPNECGCYEQTAEQMAEAVKPFVSDGLINALGGCCGTSPEHIAAVRKMVKDGRFKPRKLHSVEPLMRLSGREPLNYVPAQNMRDTYLYIGERCNVAGSTIYKKAIVDGNYEKAAGIALKQVCLLLFLSASDLPPTPTRIHITASAA